MSRSVQKLTDILLGPVFLFIDCLDEVEVNELNMYTNPYQYLNREIWINSNLIFHVNGLYKHAYDVIYADQKGSREL